MFGIKLDLFVFQLELLLAEPEHLLVLVLVCLLAVLLVIVLDVSLVQPLIIDYVDQLNCFVKQGESRKKFYKKLNYTIKQLDVEDNVILSEEDITNTIKKTITIKNNDEVEFID